MDLAVADNAAVGHLPQVQQISAGYIVISTILSSIVACTFIGNSFVIVAILIDKNLQTTANQLVLSLAVADLMVACLVMPLGAYNDINQGWWLGKEVCEFWTSADVLCCTASILNLLAIALDRYWAVTNVDYIYKRTRKRVSLMILCAWTVGAIVSLAPIFGWKDPDFARRVLDEHKCLVSQDVGYQIFATISTFYAPLVLLLALYWRIFQVARKRIRYKPGGRKKSNQAPVASSPAAAAAGATTTKLMIAAGDNRSRDLGGGGGNSCAAALPTTPALAPHRSVASAQTCARAAADNNNEQREQQSEPTRNGARSGANAQEKSSFAQVEGGAGGGDYDLGKSYRSRDIKKEICRQMNSSARNAEGNADNSGACKQRAAALTNLTPTATENQAGSNASSSSPSPYPAFTLAATELEFNLTSGDDGDAGCTASVSQIHPPLLQPPPPPSLTNDKFRLADNLASVGTELQSVSSRENRLSRSSELTTQQQRRSSLGKEEKKKKKKVNKETTDDDSAELMKGGAAAQMNGPEASKEICLRLDGGSGGGAGAGRQLNSAAAQVRETAANEEKEKVAQGGQSRLAGARNNFSRATGRSKECPLAAGDNEEKAPRAHRKLVTMKTCATTITTAACEDDEHDDDYHNHRGVRSSSTAASALPDGARHASPPASLMNQKKDLGNDGDDDDEHEQHTEREGKSSLVQLDAQQLLPPPPPPSLAQTTNKFSRHSSSELPAGPPSECNLYSSRSSEEDGDDDDECQQCSCCCANSSHVPSEADDSNTRTTSDLDEEDEQRARPHANARLQTGRTSIASAANVSPANWPSDKLVTWATLGGGGGGGQLANWREGQQVETARNLNSSACDQILTLHRELLASQGFREAAPVQRQRRGRRRRVDLVMHRGSEPAKVSANTPNSRVDGAGLITLDSPSASSLSSSASSSRSMLAAASAASLEPLQIDDEEHAEQMPTPTTQADDLDNPHESITSINMNSKLDEISRRGESLSLSAVSQNVRPAEPPPAQEKEENEKEKQEISEEFTNPSGQVPRDDKPADNYTEASDDCVLQRRLANDESPAAPVAITFKERILSSRPSLAALTQRVGPALSLSGVTRNESGGAASTLVSSARSLNIRRRFRALGQMVSFVQTSRTFNSSSSARTTSSQSDDDEDEEDEEEEFEEGRELGDHDAEIDHEKGRSSIAALQAASGQGGERGEEKGEREQRLDHRLNDHESSATRTNGHRQRGDVDERRQQRPITRSSSSTNNNNNNNNNGGNLAVINSIKVAAKLEDGTYLAPSSDHQHQAQAAAAVGTKAATASASAAARNNSSSAGGGQRNEQGKQSGASQAQLRRQNIEIKREKKAAKTLAIITGVFVCCWLPFFLNAILMPICGAACTPSDLILSVLLWLGYLNSLLNPIIYTIFSPDFRRAFHRLLCWPERSSASCASSSSKLAKELGKSKRRTTTTRQVNCGVAPLSDTPLQRRRPTPPPPLIIIVLTHRRVTRELLPSLDCCHSLTSSN